MYEAGATPATPGCAAGSPARQGRRPPRALASSVHLCTRRNSGEKTVVQGGWDIASFSRSSQCSARLLSRDAGHCVVETRSPTCEERIRCIQVTSIGARSCGEPAWSQEWARPSRYLGPLDQPQRAPHPTRRTLISCSRRAGSPRPIAATGRSCAPIPATRTPTRRWATSPCCTTGSATSTSTSRTPLAWLPATSPRNSGWLNASSARTNSAAPFHCSTAPAAHATRHTPSSTRRSAAHHGRCTAHRARNYPGTPPTLCPTSKPR
jgi:hypothetical protein